MRSLNICKSCSKFESVTFPIIEDISDVEETRCLCKLKTNEWIVKEMYERQDRPVNCLMNLEYIIMEQKY